MLLDELCTASFCFICELTSGSLLEQRDKRARQTIGHLRVPLSLSFEVNLSAKPYENDFDLHENETAYRTHFHMKGFAIRVVLKQRHKRTRKWPLAAGDHGLLTFKLTPRYMGIFVYNICLISINNTVSDGATKTLVLSIEVP